MVNLNARVAKPSQVRPVFCCVVTIYIYNYIYIHGKQARMSSLVLRNPFGQMVIYIYIYITIEI